MVASQRKRFSSDTGLAEQPSGGCVLCVEPAAAHKAGGRQHTQG
jgi:hypothetical protein